MPQLHRQDQETLLRIARNSVEAHLAGKPLTTPPAPAGPLAEPRGAFVSLHRGGELRGCVGRIESTDPLVQTVAECAVAAANNDPRFAPLDAAEMGDVEFEISVLSPVEEVTDIAQIEVGTHGLIVTQGRSRGLLLPQVATQFHLNREQFLNEACRKAGLPASAWRQGATIHRFTAEVFS